MASKIPLYGLFWEPHEHELNREIVMIRKGGQWKKKSGEVCGLGLFFHWRRFVEIAWPEVVWHKWNILELECYLKHRIIVEIGPASSGKTHSAAINLLTDYYCFPECTTGLVSSTTRESLEMRIWGEIKKHHRLAKSRINWLPGNLIEGRQRIVTDSRAEASEGRDFRNGIVGVACKKGQNYQGLGEYVGIKNARMRLVGDELHFMPKDYVNAIANLSKNKHPKHPDDPMWGFKGLGLGNPKETTDALGIMAEPAAYLGGWDGGMDQTPTTKTWETRFENGVCIQLPGSDSPNKNGDLGIPLISQRDIDADIKFYGKDSLQYTMMDEGMMPRGQGNRRILTRHLCLKFHAMEEPVWLNEEHTAITFCDAAYRGVGGDRTTFGELWFGQDNNREQIIALISMDVIPTTPEVEQSVEDQIVDYVMRHCENRRIPPQNFYFDATGRGSLVSAFARLWSPQVNGIEFGGKPTERTVQQGLDIRCREYYSKFVTELWYSVRLCVEAGQFRGMTEEVMAEGCLREWKFTEGNKIEVEPKDAMKIKSGRSPDLFDALAAGVEGARQHGFVIARLSSFVARRSDSAWKDQLRERADRLHRSKNLVYRT